MRPFHPARSRLPKLRRSARKAVRRLILEHLESRQVLASEVQVFSNGLELFDGTSVVSFGDSPLGQSVEKTFTVRNAGQDTLVVQPVTVPAGFLVTRNLGANQAIEPNAEATFAVQLDGRIAGDGLGTLAFATNDSNESVFDFKVLGSVATNKGTKFWVAFQPNHPDVTPTLSLFVTGDVATSGALTTADASYSTTFVVTPGTVTELAIPAAIVSKIIPVGAASITSANDKIANTGINITSAAPITVYGLNRAPATTDGFLGLPETVLGTSYLVMAYGTTFPAQSQQLSVVAASDNTLVTITPNVTIGSRIKGVPYNVTLNKGQVYFLLNTSTSGELAGTSVTASKPIAVFSGHTSGLVPNGVTAADHMTEQLPPVDTLGNRFALVPLGDQPKNLYRVIASANATTVKVNGTTVATLDRGQSWIAERSVAAMVEANRPLLVAQFAEGGSSTTDPFMQIIPAIDQFATSYTLATPSVTALTRHFINIVVPTISKGAISRNGTLIPASSFTDIASSGFSYAQILVSRGTHRLESTGGVLFGATLYGWGSFESYGYLGGQVFRKADIEVSVDGTVMTSGVSAVDFGKALLNSTVQKTVTIRNASSIGELSLGQIVVPTGFTLVSGPAATTLGPNEATSFVVKINSSSLGAKTGELVIPNDDMDENPFRIMLSGIVAVPKIELTTGTTPIINGSGSVDFGSNAINQPISKTLTIRNTGDFELSLGTVVTTGAGFSITSQPSAIVAADNGQTTFRIQFDPQSVGERTATVTIPNSDPTKNPFTFLVTGFTYDQVDLVVTDIQVDASTTVGGTVDLTWRVTNQGSGEFRGAFSDRIGLSKDNQIGNDQFLGDFGFSGTLLPEQSTTRTQRITLPGNLTGDHYFVINTDALTQIVETVETNNTAIDDQPLNILAPDLQILDIQVASIIPTGTQTQVNWKVRNAGSGTTLPGATWFDKLYLSSDALLDVGDLQLASVRNPQALAVNEAYANSANVNIPYGTYGVRFVIIQTDSLTQVVELSETNNVSTSGSTNISWQPPDLRVTNVVAQYFAFAGAPTRIAWDVRNFGMTAMLASEATWYDRVWLSADTTLSSNDYSIGEFMHTGLLQPGDGYAQSLDITLPPASSIPAGDYYVIVETDSRQEVKEGPFEFNNVTSETSKTQVVHLPPPDLVVESIVAPPATLYAGQTLSTGFRVKNAGAGSTEASNTQWSDRVYLSTDKTFDSNDRLIANVPHSGGLAVSAAYDVATNIVVPNDLVGVYHVIVVTNALAQVFGDDLSNNTSITSGSLTVQKPPADLDVTAVSSPEYGVVGGPLTVDYVVKNTGPQATQVAAWKDRLYLSADARLDASDLLLDELAHNGSLEPGAEYRGTFTKTVDQAGSFYFIVQADSADDVLEIDSTNNIQSSLRAVKIVPTPANLTTSRVVVPSTVAAGFEMPVSFRVTNTGPNATLGTSWIDRIYVSADETLDGNDILLKTMPHEGRLQASPDFYDGTTRVELPKNMSGSYFVIVKADDTDAIFELDNQDNIASTSLTVVPPAADLIVASLSSASIVEAGSSLRVDWTIQNQGTSDTIVSSWREQIYLSSDNIFSPSTDLLLKELVVTNRNGLDVGPLGAEKSVSRSELVTLPNVHGQYYMFTFVDATDLVREPQHEDNNVSVAFPVTINQRDVDLRVTSAVAPATAMEGVPFSVSWAVKNFGTSSTLASFWYDDVYLSTDNQLSANDLRLGSVRRNNGLGANEQYTATSSFAIPLGVVTDSSSAFYVLLSTDGGEAEQVIEIAEDNNVLATTNPITVSRGTIAPLPNLQVLAVGSPASGQDGRPVTVSWSVQNSGPGNITNQTWIDSIYLSLDKQLDRQAGANRDIYLGYRQQSRSLESGTSYSDNATFTLPKNLAGDYYVLVATDSGSTIAEGSVNELDNVGVSPLAMSISPTPPADLVVGTITIPASGLAAQTATITYTVTNLGLNPAKGSWYDSLYLSADDVWDVDDGLFRRVLHEGDLLANASYTQTVTATLPGLFPGDYRIIVRSDILNQIVESNEANNIRATLDALSLDVQALALGIAAQGTMQQSQAYYYKVAVPAGETLVIELDAQSKPGVTELHASSGSLPSRTRADYSAVDDLVTNRRLVIESTNGETYYILAYGSQFDKPTDFSLVARVVPFQVLDTNFGAGSNSGDRTIAVSGTKFDSSLKAALTRNGAVVVTAATPLLEGTTRAYMTFDLRDVPLGKYDVKFSIDGSDPITINNSFEVVAGASGHLVYRTNGAVRSVRRAQVSYDLIVANDGLNDVTLPMLRLTSDNAAFQLSRELQGAQTNSVDFLPIAKNGDRSILRPGEQIIIPFSTIATSLGSSTFAISSFADSNPLALSGVRETVFDQLASSDSGDLNEKWSTIQDEVGSTVRSLRLSMLGYQPFGDGSNPSIVTVRDYFQSLLTSEFAGVPQEQSGNSNRDPDPTPGGVTVRSARTIAKPLGYAIHFNPINSLGTIDRSRAVDPTKPTVFIIHGYTDDGGNPANGFSPPPWIRINATALRLGSGFVDGGNANIVVVDWSEGAGADRSAANPFNYLQAKQNSEVLGESIAAYMQRFGIRPEATTLIGHSLGGQAAGDTGEAVKQLFHGRQIQTIIALDEAGPLFENEVNSRRLDASDAAQVTSLKSSRLLGNDVHTADGSFYLNACFDPSGHVDFYDHGFPYITFLGDHAFGREAILPVLLVGGSVTDVRTGRVIAYQDLLQLAGASIFVTNENLECEEEGPLDPDLGDPGSEDWKWVTEIVQSIDPNDIIGPDGFGPERWMAATAPLDYMIRFENDPEFATAPAQQIRITQTLDSDLDFRTFRLGDIGIGDIVIDVPDNRPIYSTRLDLRESKGIYVDVFAGINVTTGEAFWNLTAIDPLTGELPEDASQGLLPPNINPPEGDGVARYTIRAKSDVTTGTRIDAKARIIFDINEPIETPTIFNTLDAVAPTSQVALLGSELVTYQGRFLVSWSGMDDDGGSALRGFDIYVRVDDGQFQPWLTNVQFTTAVYDGPVGTKVSFYSVAHDNVGLFEAVPADSDTAIRVVAPLDIAIEVDGVSMPVGTGTINFGSSILSTPMIEKVLTVRNTGKQAVTLGSASVTPNSDFSVIANLTDGMVLQPGQTTSFTVGMQPVQVGRKLASVQFATDVSGKSPFILSLTGEVLDVPALTLALESDSIEETGAFLIGSVARNTAVDKPLVVSLQTSDENRSRVPANVTIPAGASSVTFRLTPVNDSIPNGAHAVSIFATASGLTPATIVARVIDDEVSILSLALTKSSMPEGGEPVIGTVTRNTPTTAPLTVTLSSQNTSVATVPATVTIPAGSTSATFIITSVNDDLSNADQTVVITASADDFVSGEVELQVMEDDPASLSVRLAVSSILENSGTTTGTVTRNTPSTSPLTVQLTSTNPGAATVAASVTIPTGAMSATFSITILNDTRYLGNASTQIVTNAIGLTQSSANLEILEDDPQWPWHNSRKPLDVNADGVVSPIDALLVINYLNTGFNLLPEPKAGELAPPPYVDVNQDGRVTPIDALLVINELNNPSGGEGEKTDLATIVDYTFGDLGWLDSLAADIRRLKKL